MTSSDAHQARPSDGFLLSNPFYRGMAETGLLVLSGITGLCRSWRRLPLSPWSNLAGALLYAVGMGFHVQSEKNHEEAHETAEKITTIARDGAYSRIRHPLYLGIIIGNIGIALFFGIAATLVLAILSILHWALTALKEEDFLLGQYPEEYSRYQSRTPWRFIPGIF